MKRALAFIIITLIYIILAITVVNKAFADCGQYGGTCPPSSQIVINKTIKDPAQSGDIYVDNLGISNHHFVPNEDVIFKIEVRNAGNTDLTNVQVTDTIPPYTNFVMDDGSINSTIRNITKSYSLMHPGDVNTFFIRVRVLDTGFIPTGVTCGSPNAINNAVATADNQPNTSDSSSFCIERTTAGAVVTTPVPVSVGKGGVTVTQPKTGAELYIAAFGLLGLSIVGALGKKLIARE